MNIRHIDIGDLESEAAKIPTPECVYIDTPTADGSCFGGKYLIGLCPKCDKPIGFDFCNGGKCSPRLTLDIRHLLTGSNKCDRKDYDSAMERKNAKV